MREWVDEASVKQYIGMYKKNIAIKARMYSGIGRVSWTDKYVKKIET